ncbi:MAG TPA: RNA methyltransferase [Chitinophagaceae bacterium]|nr:RNA methyltransferase [Chitinophagaceae bacterium]
MPAKSQLKYIQSLGYKKQRDTDGVFLAEGPKIVDELLRSPHTDVLEIYALPGWIKTHGSQAPGGIKVNEVSDAELRKISQLATPNQVLAVVKQWHQGSLPGAGTGWWLALDTIQDPGNMGTIIRIADWFGINGIIGNGACADRYNPKVVQSTMGSIARVPVWYGDLAGWLLSAQEKGARVYGALLQGQPVEKMIKPAGGILVIGNESQGIGPEIAGLINVKVTIPGKGQAESLNAAVATGILLSHLC